MKNFGKLLTLVILICFLAGCATPAPTAAPVTQPAEPAAPAAAEPAAAEPVNRPTLPFQRRQKSPH